MGVIGNRSQGATVAALERALALAAEDPNVPGAIARVWAPRIGLDWSGAAGSGALQGGGGLSADQPFRIASTTKIYVAAAVLRLMETGKVDLQQPIVALVRGETASALKGGGYDVERITVAQLLNHTSGLLDHVQTPTYAGLVTGSPRRVWTRIDQVAHAMMAGRPLDIPGRTFRYSDTGYVILGEIIERLTGEPVGPAVRRLCGLDALGLASTYWERLEARPSGLATNARQYLNETDCTDVDPSFDLHGGGGLVSTVGDMATFARALVQGRVYERPETLAAAFVVPHARRDTDAFPFLHANGFMLFPMGRRPGWGHAGFWGCVAVYSPELDVAVAATINQARPSEPYLLPQLVASLTGVVDDRSAAAI
jgi:D-alanyl-D-alanine carboxypeptidase